MTVPHVLLLAMLVAAAATIPSCDPQTTWESVACATTADFGWLVELAFDEAQKQEATEDGALTFFTPGKLTEEEHDFLFNHPDTTEFLHNYVKAHIVRGHVIPTTTSSSSLLLEPHATLQVGVYLHSDHQQTQWWASPSSVADHVPPPGMGAKIIESQTFPDGIVHHLNRRLVQCFTHEHCSETGFFCNPRTLSCEKPTPDSRIEFNLQIPFEDVESEEVPQGKIETQGARFAGTTQHIKSQLRRYLSKFFDVRRRSIKVEAVDTLMDSRGRWKLGVTATFNTIPNQDLIDKFQAGDVPRELRRVVLQYEFECEYGEWSSWGSCVMNTCTENRTRSTHIIREPAACSGSLELQNRTCPPNTCALSQGKPVSGTTAGGNLAALVDGNLDGADWLDSPRDNAANCETQKYVQVDLEQVVAISRLLLFQSIARTYCSRKIETSLDGTNWDVILDDGTAATNIMTESGHEIDMGCKQAQFVRWYSSRNSINSGIHFLELQVFGCSL